ncbi:hypothetical protein DRQ36_00340 [bacterium]|nr:MAG: hypothetical protein DRQ36_00340 [bacterium]
MRKCLVAIFLLLVISAAFAEDIPEGILDLVTAYKQALDERSVEFLDGKLAKDFDFAGAGQELSTLVLEQIVSTGVYNLEEIYEIEVEYSGDTAHITISALVSSSGIQQESVDMFDAITEDGIWKILKLGQGVAQPMIIQDPTKDLVFSVSGPARTVVKFAPELDHIVIEAGLSDGSTVNFVVDNGTPISIIDARYADRFEPLGDLAALQAMGVSGEIGNTGAVTVDLLKIEDIEIENLMAITMDISHLSDALDTEIIGLLGTDFLGRFAWTLDYSGRKIILSRLDDNGRPLDETDPLISTNPSHTIGFERTMHLLYVAAEFAPGVVANVILDSGAGGGVITPEIFEKLPEKSYEPGESDTLMGADKEKRVVKSITPKELRIGPVSRSDYIIAISDLSHLDIEGLPTKVDGIIGYNFFQDWLITTWFDKNVIELRPIPK